MNRGQSAVLCALVTAACLAPAPADTAPDVGHFSGAVSTSSGPRLAAVVYKWVDEQGTVHYGDCPPDESTAEQVPVAPPPPLEAVGEAEERARLIGALTESEARAPEPPGGSSAEKFKDNLVRRLSDPELRRSAKAQDATGLYQFGQGICDGLRQGLSKRQILENSYYHFWGVEMSRAMWDAALTVICPESAP